MALQENWTINETLGADGMVQLVGFQCEFTDPDKPGVAERTAGKIAIQPVAAGTEKSAIVSQVKAALGPRWNDIVAYHTDQLAFRYMVATAEPYTPPDYVEPTPEEIRAAMPPLSARQLRLGLVQGGFTLAQVEAAIDALPDQTQRELARIEWEYATQFERLHPLLLQVGVALGLTDEQVDTMWTGAKDL